MRDWRSGSSLVDLNKMNRYLSKIILCCVLILAQNTFPQKACSSNATDDRVNAHEAMQEAKRFSLKGDLKNTIAAYQKAADLAPDDVEIQNALVSAWEQALKANPLDPENHIGLGQAFQHRGDFGQAEEEYKQAIRFSPGKTNPLASKLMAGLAAAKVQANISKHVNSGVTLQAKKQYDAAIEGVKGNPDANSNPNGRPSVAAQADVDFGLYMADVIKRIKKAWFPPKGHEGERVTVIFKVHRGGELSNLRLDHSSGDAIADQAALKAVENAAPFRPLPAGAKENVDIRYTFSGDAHGTKFRSF